MTDDFTHQAIEAKYDDMDRDAARLNAMSAEERGEYYHALYQYFERMMFIVHEASCEQEPYPYPNLSQSEWWALSAVGHAFNGLVDGLAGLIEIAEEQTND